MSSTKKDGLYWGCDRAQKILADAMINANTAEPENFDEVKAIYEACRKFTSRIDYEAKQDYFAQKEASTNGNH